VREVVVGFDEGDVTIMIDDGMICMTWTTEQVTDRSI
jgi:hypothetical protein